MPPTELREEPLGRGDFVAGGARTEPFLSQDGARPRRPLVMGEVLAVPPDDPLVEGMFSGRASDPLEWGVMWRELGADGVCLRLDGAEDPAGLAGRMAERTGLPVAVSGPREAVEACSDIEGTRLLMIGGDPGASGHAVGIEVGDECDAKAGNGVVFMMSGAFPEPDAFLLAGSIRRRALAGDPAFDAPIAFDVTPVWHRGFGDAFEASMMEGEAALTAMLHGADIVIVRGPGAADMARVYGEELAGL